MSEETSGSASGPESQAESFRFSKVIKNSAKAYRKFAGAKARDASEHLNKVYTEPARRGQKYLYTYALAGHIVWAPLFHVVLALLFSLALFCLWLYHAAAYYTAENKTEHDNLVMAALVLGFIFSTCAVSGSVWWMVLYLRTLRE